MKKYTVTITREIKGHEHALLTVLAPDNMTTEDIQQLLHKSDCEHSFECSQDLDGEEFSVDDFMVMPQGLSPDFAKLEKYIELVTIFADGKVERKLA